MYVCMYVSMYACMHVCVRAPKRMAYYRYLAGENNMCYKQTSYFSSSVSAKKQLIKVLIVHTFPSLIVFMNLQNMFNIHG